MQQNEASVSGKDSLPLNVEAILKEANPVIKFKAYRLMRLLRGAPVSQQDIEAELQLHLIKRLKRFDRSRGQLSTFVKCVLDHRCISIVRYWRALKRNPSREAGSLQETVQDADGRAVYRSEITIELGRDPWNEVDLDHDLTSATEEMPAELQESLQRRRQQKSIPESRRLAMKKYLEDKGLDIYLE